MAQWFAEGGSSMLIVALLDALGLVALLLAWIMALVARLRGRTGFLVKAFPALVLMGSFLPVVVGAIGYLQGRSATIQAAAHAAPNLREALLAQGHEIALIPLRFGGVSTVVLGSLAVLALMIAPWRARS